MSLKFGKRVRAPFTTVQRMQFGILVDWETPCLQSVLSTVLSLWSLTRAWSRYICYTMELSVYCLCTEDMQVNNFSSGLPTCWWCFGYFLTLLYCCYHLTKLQWKRKILSNWMCKQKLDRVLTSGKVWLIGMDCGPLNFFKIFKFNFCLLASKTIPRNILIRLDIGWFLVEKYTTN